MAEREMTISPHARAHVDQQFVNLEHQHETRLFGMWVFLLTEILLFSVLFTTYTVYHVVYPEAFVQGSRGLDATIGVINTAVLILSSVMMALAVNSAQLDRRGALVIFLLLTAAFGSMFMGIKAYEYYRHYVEGFIPGVNWTYQGANAGPLQLFYFLYFAMTGVHAVHLTIGIGVVLVIALRALRGDFRGGYFTPVEMTGLYWHFVDVVWIFLFPLLYLIGGR